MKFTDYKCPVCQNTFAEEDDVVVCPDCGTPHHRKCYLENGKCFNENKHGTNEPIEVEFTPVENEENTAPADNIEENNETSNKQDNFDSQQVVQEIFEEINNSRDIFINGVHVSYYEAAIGKNQKYYIPRFMLIDKTKKTFVWNIAGFFVPLAWSIYRKMYKISAIILALYVLTIGSIGFSILGNEEITAAAKACAEEDPYFAEDILLYASTDSGVTLTEKQMNFYKLSNEFKLPLIIRIFRYVVVYGTRMIMGIYATNMYYASLKKKIEQVEKTTLSPDMKRSVLYRKCGTLPIIIAVLIGLFEWQMF